MQIERQFGFLVTTPTPVPQDEYLDLKTNLEDVCKHITRKAKQYQQEMFCFAVRLTDLVYFTAHIQNGTILTGILDFKQRKIHQEYPFEDTKRLLSGRYDDVKFVAESTIKDFSLGKPQHLPELSKMWDEIIRKMEAAKSPQTSKEDLHLISKEFFNNEEVCLNIVKNPSVSQQTLYCLAHNPYISVKVEITKIQRVHPKVLRVLLNDPQVGGYAELHPGYAKLMGQKQNTLKL